MRAIPAKEFGRRCQLGAWTLFLSGITAAMAVCLTKNLISFAPLLGTLAGWRLGAVGSAGADAERATIHRISDSDASHARSFLVLRFLRLCLPIVSAILFMGLTVYLGRPSGTRAIEVAMIAAILLLGPTARWTIYDSWLYRATLH